MEETQATMDKQETTHTCSQCHKEVGEANFSLHEMHCSRFLCVCPDCDEAVPRAQLSQHKEEQHTETRCSKCNQRMQRCQLKDHELEECVGRLQECQYCELELPWKELEHHCLVCRPELCRECGRYVTLRDQPEHGSTCSASGSGSSRPPQTSSTPPNATDTCGGSKASFPTEDTEKHERQSVPPPKREEEWEDKESLTFPQLSSAYKAKSRTDRVDGKDISTCPHCHLALPIPTLSWHQAKCKIHSHLNNNF